MSKKIERALKRSAEARGIPKGSERYKRYVYGTLAKIKKQSKEQNSGSTNQPHAS